MNSLIVFLLDDSESMHPYASATRQGFNEFLTAQQYRQDDCAIFMAKFGNHYDVLHAFTSIFDVPLLTEASYYPGQGGTALYDSINLTIEKVEAHIATLPIDQQPRVTFVMQTDGEDNKSLDQNNNTSFPNKVTLQYQSSALTKVRAALQSKRNEGWHLLFLATGDKGQAAADVLLLPPAEVLAYETTAAGSVFGMLNERVYDTMYETEN